jgi:hypothetical protein
LWLIAVGLALIAVPTAVTTWPLMGPGLVPGPLRIDTPVGGSAEALLGVGVNLVGLSLLASVISLGLRFRRATDVERQQLKWLLYAGGLTFVVTATASPAAPFDLSSTDLPTFVSTLLSILAYLALMSIPVAVGIAILKYRLYDIDIVINRTLVYGVLTATLVGVYLGGVVSLQAVFRALTGQESQLAIVASTLAIAALFGPVRRRIQSFIDRRFYRRKYDAARTLENFSAKLRDETDLDALTRELTSVVRETMQPEHVTLWMRPTGHEGGQAKDV